VIATKNERVTETIFLGARVMSERLKQIQLSGFLGKRNYSVITRSEKYLC
jgi:hypothetical protein